MKRRHGFNPNGLDGSSGVIGRGVHVSAQYGARKGEVFIEDMFDDGDMRFLSWRRVRRVWAKRHTCRVIRCRVCGNPAVSIDHHFPYYSTMNRCAAESCQTAEVDE
jgi:hypothetical protein